MNQEEMMKEFYVLYNMMANSNKVEFMHVFGQVHKEMFEWFVANKPEMAQEWLDKLESIRWRNYLTPTEAEDIVSKMEPKAPWTRDQWNEAMKEHGFQTEEEPYYNRCALYVTMNMKMSDSGHTFSEYVDEEDIFPFVYKLAVDSLKDRDGVFSVRRYFSI